MEIPAWLSRRRLVTENRSHGGPEMIGASVGYDPGKLARRKTGRWRDQIELACQANGSTGLDPY
jgi:hypothetical protein